MKSLISNYHSNLWVPATRCQEGTGLFYTRPGEMTRLVRFCFPRVNKNLGSFLSPFMVDMTSRVLFSLGPVDINSMGMFSTWSGCYDQYEHAFHHSGLTWTVWVCFPWGLVDMISTGLHPVNMTSMCMLWHLSCHIVAQYLVSMPP